MYSKYIKRFLDIITSFIALSIALPFLLIIALLLFYFNDRKIFFFQKRVGLNEKIFSIIKFKTMTDKRDLNGELLPDGERITALGKFIRKYSIDELPQLLNVLNGDMSLIGPRPLLIDYLDYYSEEQKRRHHIRPGITGWAQVNGRNSISWKDKFLLDIYYVDNCSFLLDCKILYLTFYKVVTSSGVNAREEVTMEKFDGTN